MLVSFKGRMTNVLNVKPLTYTSSKYSPSLIQMVTDEVVINGTEFTAVWIVAYGFSSDPSPVWSLPSFET